MLKDRPGRVLQGVLALVLLLFGGTACASGAGAMSDGNWQASALQQRQIRVIAVNAKDAGKLYAASAQGNIFVTTDAGQHWTERSSGLVLPNPVHMLVSSLDGQKIFAATDNGLFTSSATADSWKQATGLPVDHYTAVATSVRTSGTLYLGSALHGVSVSTDGGETWKQLGTGLPQNAEVNGLIEETQNGHLWAALSSGVYRLDTPSGSWRPFNTGLTPDITANALLPASTVGGKTGEVYLGTNKGFFLSKDDGAHWERGQASLSGTVVHQVLVDFRASGNNTIYLATDYGALRSIDGGQDWGLIATGLPQKQPVSMLVLGTKDYSQLFAAADKLYLFPGTSGGLNIARILPIVIIMALFYLLTRFMRIGRKRRTLTAQITPPDPTNEKQPDEQSPSPPA